MNNSYTQMAMYAGTVIIATLVLYRVVFGTIVGLLGRIVGLAASIIFGMLGAKILFEHTIGIQVDLSSYVETLKTLIR